MCLFCSHFKRRRIILYLKYLIILLFGVMSAAYIYMPTRIPQIIHYVWVGSEKVPPSVEKAVATWRNNMPDWKVIRWSEKNCPIEQNPYALKMYKEKKYRYVSDYCRFYALEKYGGLYLDTDMFLTNSIEKYLTAPLVFVLEQKERLSAGIFAVSPHHPFSKAVLDFYSRHQGQEIDAPILMTFIFFKLYSKPPLLKFSDKKTVIYPPNYMMLDFGGPENAAEHWYATGSSKFDSRGPYYDLFSKYFLSDYAFRLYDADKEAHYAVLLFSTDQFYIVKKQQRRWRQVKSSFGKYILKNNILILRYFKKKSAVKAYVCEKRECVILKPDSGVLAETSRELNK